MPWPSCPRAGCGGSSTPGRSTVRNTAIRSGAGADARISTVKEHTCITIFASTASTTAEAISIVAVLNLYYNLDLNPGVAILQTWGSQVIGYGFSGILQKMVVYPT